MESPSARARGTIKMGGLEEKLRQGGAIQLAANSTTDDWHVAIAQQLSSQSEEHRNTIAGAESAFHARTARTHIQALAEIGKSLGSVEAAKKERTVKADPQESFIDAADLLTPTGWEEKYLPQIKAIGDVAFGKFMMSEEEDLNHAIYQEVSRLITRLQGIAMQGEGARQERLRRALRSGNVRAAV